MMNANQYRWHLKKLGMTQRGVSHLLGITDRSSRRFASGADVPRAIELLLRIMVHHQITPDEAMKLGGYPLPREGWGDARFSDDE